MNNLEAINTLSSAQKNLAKLILIGLYNANGAYDPIRYEKLLDELRLQTGEELTLTDVKHIMLQLEVHSFVEEHCCNSWYKIKPKGIKFIEISML